MKYLQSKSQFDDYLKTFENYNNNSTLIIVDVQKSFSKYFTDNYVEAVKKYCKEFSKVYQIFDNHVDGKNVDKDYLYNENPVINTKEDLYEFYSSSGDKAVVIEKRYNYDVDADFYKKILDKDVYKDIKDKEDNGSIKRGDLFNTNTKEKTVIVYIGNNHVFFHCPKKLYDLFKELEGQEVTIIGGSRNECILDVTVTATSMGVKNIIENKKYIYSASFCPIK